MSPEDEFRWINLERASYWRSEWGGAVGKAWMMLSQAERDELMRGWWKRRCA
jgi:hypothetical protein